MESSPSLVVSKSDTTVIKSPNDKRLYRVLHLTNGLCAVLVHDPEIFSAGESSETLTDNEEEGSDESSYSEGEDDDEDMEGEDSEIGEEEDDVKKKDGALPTKKVESFAPY